jgi:transcriptional regulator with XRE-family HTH domain
MVDFATNFKRLCNERGTTPTNVCKALGLSTSKVNMWNNGSLPKQEMLVTLAKHLNCSVMDFFMDEELNNFLDTPLNDDELDILKVYRSLDRRDKHEFMTLIYQFENKTE